MKKIYLGICSPIHGPWDRKFLPQRKDMKYVNSELSPNRLWDLGKYGVRPVHLCKSIFHSHSIKLRNKVELKKNYVNFLSEFF